MDNQPYYASYDDHYRALYAHGIPYWSDGPDHCKANIERVISRVHEALPSPEGAIVLEVGCGEGHLAAALVGLGMVYAGMDFSAHAIAKARARASEQNLDVQLFVADILNPSEAVTGSTYDLILDQACLNMFVVDDDRARYLAVVRKLLRPEAAFVLTNQPRDEGAYEGKIASIREFEQRFGVDLSKPQEWEAWDGERWVEVELPAFACRPRSRQAYVEEFEAAGFTVRRVYESGSAKQFLDFILGPRRASERA